MTMSTRTIPLEKWKSFFDAFTRQHHGWLVTIGDAAPEPLERVSADGRNIEVRAGSSHYRLPNTTTVVVTTADNDETAIDHLEIDHLTIRFRAAINPQLVDGVMP